MDVGNIAEVGVLPPIDHVIGGAGSLFRGQFFRWGMADVLKVKEQNGRDIAQANYCADRAGFSHDTLGTPVLLLLRMFFNKAR